MKLQKLFFSGGECFCLDHNQTRGLDEKHIQLKLKQGLMLGYWQKIQSGLIKENEKEFYKTLGPQILSVENLRYFNGKGFGQVCAKAKVFLEPQIWRQYRGQDYVLEKFCFYKPDLKVKDLPLKARRAALKRLIKKYFPPCQDMSLAEIRRAVIGTCVENAVFDFEKKTICFDYKARIVPALLRKRKKQVFALPELTKKQPEGYLKKFKLDLKDKEVGDILPEYGQHLVVQLGSEGKGIATVNESGATAYFKCLCGEDFDLTICLYHKVDLNFGFFTKILKPFELRYDNYKKDELEIHLQKDQGGPLKTIFIMGDNEIEMDDFYLAANYNEYRFVKKGNSLRIFSNGKYVTTFFTDGKGLKMISVRLNRGDILYNIVCESKPM